MKCVLINSWYQQYSTGKLVYAFRSHMIQQGHSVLTFYGHGNPTTDKDVFLVGNKYSLYAHALLCRTTGYEGTFSTLNTKKVIKQMEEFKPDVVYLFNLHAYYLNEYLLLNYLKDSGIKTIYMLFDEYPYLGRCTFAGNCEKYKTQCSDCHKVHEYPVSMFFDQSKVLFNKKKVLFENWNQVTLAGVEFLRRGASMSAISKNTKFIPIDMGVKLKETYYPREVSKLREKLQIPENHKIVVTVGPYSDPRKGIKKLVEIAKICATDPITFINIGFDGDKSKLPDNFIGISYVSDQDELAMYYSLADVYVMTSSGEAMSLTCMEALGCGSKLIGFNISGTPYAASEEFGVFVPFDDLIAFADAIRRTEKKTEQSIKACRDYALSRYEISDFMRNLEKIGTEN